MISLETQEQLPGKPQEIIPSPEIWVAKLFDELSKTLNRKDPKKEIFEISSKLKKDSSQPTNNISGIVIRGDGKDFVMVLGEKQRNPEESPTSSFQFGIKEIKGIISDRKDLLHTAQSVLDKKTTGVFGEFFVDPEKGLVFDFISSLKKPEVEAIKSLSQEELLTRKGLDLSIQMIQSILKP